MKGLAQAEQAHLAETFVGRESERAIVRQMIEATKTDTVGVEAPQLLYVHGPGGIGKTSLLTMCAALAADAGLIVSRLDGRDVEPSPAALDAALAAIGLVGDDAPRFVALDTFEVLRPIDDRTRAELVRRFGSRTIGIVASRTVPSIGWRTMATWGGRVRGLALDRLAPDEARRYLELRHLSPNDVVRVMQLAKGNPLALALAADVDRTSAGSELVPERDPDVIATLCERLLRVEVDPAHQSTLELCGLMRTVTEEIIGALVPESDPAREFRWLRDKTFVRASAGGLVAHDLARDAIADELRWRNPERFDAIQQRALEWLAERADRPDASFDDMLLQVTHLVRNVPSLAAMFDLPVDSEYVLDVARSDDRAAMQAMVSRFEGPTNASLVEHWFARQPEAFQIVRDTRGEVAAISTLLDLTRTTAKDREPDLAARTIWDHARARRTERDRGEVSFCRFTMGRDRYQAAEEQMVWASFLAVQPLRLPTIDLSYSYIRSDHLFWRDAWKLTGAVELPYPTYTIDGVDYLVGTIDRRRMTAGRWLAETAKRALRSMKPEPALPASQPTPATRVPAEFADAVRAALRSFHDTKRLSHSPLLERLVRDRQGDRVEALRAMLRRTVAAIGESPKLDRLARVLTVTYVNGAESQELAAEALGLSFGTYRRHLQRAIDELTERLWRESRA